MSVIGKPQLRVVNADDLKIPPATRRSVIGPTKYGADTYNSHPATGLTADQLVAIFRQAEQGMPTKQFDCFDDLIEVGGHLRGLINGRIEFVAGCDWVMRPGRDDKPSELAAASLEEQLRNNRGFREFIEHHLTAPHFGIAISNIVWDLIEDTIAPLEFINAAHRRFASPNAQRAHEIWLIAGDTPIEQIALEPGLWAVSKYRHRNPWASGLMRTAAWWEMFKRWAMRDWQVFAEMFGLPLVIGYYEDGSSPATREALLEAVKMIGEDGYAVLSNMTEIVVKDTARPGDSSTVYPKIIMAAEQQQSKLIAGSTTASDTGGDVGSYSLGVVHEARSYSLARADAARIEDMVSRDIGVPFVAYNGFDRAAPPRLKIQIRRDNLERAKVLEVVGSMIEIDEDQIREEFSLRVPAPGKGVKMPAKAPAQPPKS